MYALKTIITALLLLCILPWCNLAAASMAASYADVDASFLDETATIYEADVTEARFTAPSKNKRIAVLQHVQCGVSAPLLSGLDTHVFSSGAVQLGFEGSEFIACYAQDPPTSPPRSV